MGIYGGVENQACQHLAAHLHLTCSNEIIAGMVLQIAAIKCNHLLQ